MFEPFQIKRVGSQCDRVVSEAAAQLSNMFHLVEVPQVVELLAMLQNFSF